MVCIDAYDSQLILNAGGWGDLFVPKFVTDSTVIIFGVFILFFVPSMDSKFGNVSCIVEIRWTLE